MVLTFRWHEFKLFEVCPSNAGAREMRKNSSLFGRLKREQSSIKKMMEGQWSQIAILNWLCWLKLERRHFVKWQALVAICKFAKRFKRIEGRSRASNVRMERWSVSGWKIQANSLNSHDCQDGLVALKSFVNMQWINWHAVARCLVPSEFPAQWVQKSSFRSVLGILKTFVNLNFVFPPLHHTNPISYSVLLIKFKLAIPFAYGGGVGN